MTEGKRGLVDRLPTTRTLLIIGAVILALAVPATFVLGQTAQSAADQAQSATQQLQPIKEQAQQGTDLASKIVLACTDPAQVQQLRAIGACQQAIQIQQQTPPGPTDGQISAAVDKWLSDHASELKVSGPTDAQVAAVVAQYLTEHPPAPGRPPTPDEISMATATYIAEHADQFKGAQGDSPTSADILAAVKTYCSSSTPSPCAGPKGDTGPAGANGTNGTNGADGKQGVQGVSVSDVNFSRDSSGKCQLVVTLHDPASGTNITVVHPAPDALCPVSSPPSTATSSTLTPNIHR
jgi:hypothetical protein